MILFYDGYYNKSGQQYQTSNIKLMSAVNRSEQFLYFQNKTKHY